MRNLIPTAAMIGKSVREILSANTQAKILSMERNSIPAFSKVRKRKDSSGAITLRLFGTR